MALSFEQFQELRKKGLSIEQIKDIESGNTPAVKQAAQTNQFEQEIGSEGGVSGFLKKGADFLFGGGKLAQGLGMGIAAKGVQESQTNNMQSAQDIELNLIKEIEKNRQAGLDTKRLEKALIMIRENQNLIADSQKDLVNALPTNREVVGSAGRLATNVVAGAVANGVKGGVTGIGNKTVGPTTGLLKGRRGLAAISGASKAQGFLSGAWRGALAGAGTGAVSGAGIGASNAYERGATGAETALAGLAGAGTGVLTGGALGGLTGGITGSLNARATAKQQTIQSRFVKPENQVQLFNKVTPDTAQVPKGEYNKLLQRGLIEPRSDFMPDRVLLSESQKQAVLKNADIITDNPAETAINITKRFGTLDDEVGSYLKKNNVTFQDANITKDQLKNFLLNRLEDVDDFSLSPDVVTKRKEQLVNRFMDEIGSEDFYSLWESRKNFDQSRYMQAAYKGTDTFKKELGRSLRDAVQDFLKVSTPDEQYAVYMDDMTNLNRLLDVVKMKASGSKNGSEFGNWLMKNKKLAATIGITSTTAAIWAANQTGLIKLGRDNSSGG